MSFPKIRVLTIGALAILLASLSACGPATATPAPTAVPASAPVPTAAPIVVPTAAPAPPTSAPTAAPAQIDTAAAVQTILDYYDAIGQQRYDQAYLLWAQGGAASGQTAAAFAQGHAGTAGISVLLDRATASADSVTVPITIFSVENQSDQSQQAQRFDGSYTLALESGSWKIAGATIAATDAASPPIAAVADGLSLVQAYYQAINDQNYPRAYTLWAQNGAASEQSYAAFAQGFAQTVQVDLTAGSIQTSGAAGSIYAQLPVVIFAHQRDGSTQPYCGTYTLRRTNVPPFDSFGWRIQSAGLLAVADVAPGSDLIQQLLGGQCAAR
ncbi:hypothetical protein EKD04_025705 [Chloroflexales bacterium ZM16-3]|nr:hypothetical protein [Chloroflexales bacterium ZM16-3]